MRIRSGQIRLGDSFDPKLIEQRGIERNIELGHHAREAEPRFVCERAADCLRVAGDYALIVEIGGRAETSIARGREWTGYHVEFVAPAVANIESASIADIVVALEIVAVGL